MLYMSLIIIMRPTHCAHFSVSDTAGL